MKFEADREALLVACVTAARAVASKGIRPVLGSVHLVVGDGGLMVTGTDLETAVCTKAPATIHEDGAAALPAKQLIEILRRCGDGVVRVSSEKGDGAKVAWQRSKFELRGYDPADFPAVQWPSQWEAAPGLREAAVRCVFAASSGETARALLTGVNLSEQGAMATDGFQMAHCAQALKIPSTTVPASALAMLAQIAPDGDVEFAMQGTQICFQAGDVRMSSRVLEGKYFALLDMIPKQFAMTVSVDRKALLGALARVLTVVEHEPPYAVTVTPKGETIVISGRSEAGEAQEEVAATCKVAGKDTKPFAFGINGRQLMEGVKALRGDALVLKAAGPKKLTGYEDGSEFRYYQMPLQMPDDQEAEVAKSA